MFVVRSRQMNVLSLQLSAAMDTDETVISGDELRDKYRALIEAACANRAIFRYGDDAALRDALLDSWHLHAVIGAQFFTEDSFIFGAAASKIRPEIERLADAHQSAKLSELEISAVSDLPHRANALFGALYCLSQRLDVVALRPHW